MGVYSYTMYGIMKRNSKVNRDRIAFSCGEEAITNEQLLEKVDGLASGLSNLGLQKGDRISVLAQNSLEYIYLYGATSKIGVIMVPINWRLKSKEIEYIVSDASPRVIFTNPEYQDLIRPLISKGSSLERCYVIGKPEKDFEAFDDLVENNAGGQEKNISSDDEFVIIYTAAVGGMPRGATISHKSLLFNNFQFMYFWRLTPEDVQILLLPLFHNFGLYMASALLHAGCRSMIIPKFDVDLALKSIQECKVTIISEFAPMLSSLLDEAEERHYDLSSLRIAIGLDNPKTMKRFEEVTGGRFWTGYGQSETGGFITLAPFFDNPGSAGLPGFVTQVEIMDDNGRILGTGETGEIVARGPMLFKGYWNLPEENKHTFRDGWHHTGDLGRFDDDGYLWYVGRAAEKELIKPGGENVYPAEVEKTILEHPLIAEVLVVGVPNEQWGEAIKAICVLKEGATLAEQELIEFVGDRIARYKKPKYISFVSDLPKTAERMIDREKVKAEYGGT